MTRPGEQRLVVAGAPSFFERHPAPEHPRDLTRHTCINWRPGPGGNPYRWEFTENGRDFSVAVDAHVLTTDAGLNLRLAIAGVGLNMTWESWVREHVEGGETRCCPRGILPAVPGFYLYYPRRRHAPPALRALIDYVRDGLRK